MSEFEQSRGRIAKKEPISKKLVEPNIKAMKQPARRSSPERSKSLPPERPSEEDVMEKRKPRKRHIAPESSEEEKRQSRSDSQEKLTSTQQQEKAYEEKMEVDYRERERERHSSPDT